MADITITDKQIWADNLFGFSTTRPDGYRFEAGQWARLGLVDENGETIWRAYSILSSPFDEHLHFFSVVVENGAFTSRLKDIQIGDSLQLDPNPYGYLTLSRYQDKPCDLWLLATGTGVAPFLSMLQDLAVFERYRRVVLVYSVRHMHELCYQDIIKGVPEFIVQIGAECQFVYVPIVTREQGGVLNMRIPALLDGALADVVGFAIAPDAHIMICGNPQMVEDTKETLKAQGFTMNRRGVGNIAVENYW